MACFADLRLDERVLQVMRHFETKTYSVVPISAHAGVIEMVPVRNWMVSRLFSD